MSGNQVCSEQRIILQLFKLCMLNFNHFKSCFVLIQFNYSTLNVTNI